MNSVFENGGQNRQIPTGRDETTDMSAGTSAAPQSEVKEQAPWAGVTTGRDGLLGRIETSLGSII